MKKSAKKIVKKRKVSRKKKGLDLKSKFVVLFFLVSAFFLLYSAFNYQVKPVKETSISEQRRIPEGIRTKLKNPTQIYRVPVLMYHYVEYVEDKNDTTRQSLNIEPHVFEAQIKTLRDNGYTFLTASQLGNMVNGDIPLPN